MTPDVTVVIPTHNRVDVLPLTLASILAQRDVAIEVVVVDDGSSDGTAAWLAGIDDARVRVVRHEQARRLPAARNAGLLRAGAPWVAFCDDDDVWAPTKLAAQLAAVGPQARWSCTGAVAVSPDLEVIGHHRLAADDPAGALRRGNVVPGGGSAVLVDTDLARELGGFDESLRSSEDWDMWLRLIERSPLASVDRPLVAYRVWPGSMSTDVGRMEASYDALMAKHRPEDDPAALRRHDVQYQQYLARFPLAAGRRVEAAGRYARIAVRHRLPSHLVHAAVALVAPAVAEGRRARRELAEVPAVWKAEADAWLADLRGTTSGPRPDLAEKRRA